MAAVWLGEQYWFSIEMTEMQTHNNNNIQPTEHIAYVFPGQGSQKIGMLNDLSHFPIISETFAEASEILQYDLWDLIQNGPEDRLNQTTFTQPAMLTADVAVYRLLSHQIKEAGAYLKPAVMAGHSLGEYAALTCAGVISFRDAVFLVSHRGRLMQELIPAGKGAMAAIVGFEDDKVISLCEKASQGQVLEAANFNSIGQVVIAGETAAVERALAAAMDEGAKMAKIIPVSVPCHCLLLEPVAEALSPYLSRVSFTSPSTPVLHNVHARAISEPALIQDILKKQLYCPVRWVDTIHAMAAMKIQTIIECGPGSVLTGLNRRIDRNMQYHSVYDKSSLEKTMTSLTAIAN